MDSSIKFMLLNEWFTCTKFDKVMNQSCKMSKLLIDVLFTIGEWLLLTLVIMHLASVSNCPYI